MIGYQSKRNDQSRLAFHEYAAIGALVGACSRAIVQPLDVVKIRFQLQVEPISARTNVTSNVGQPAVAARYTGMLQALRRIIAEEGLKSLWKGHLAAQLQSASFTLAQFSTYEKFTEWYCMVGGALRSESPSTPSTPSTTDKSGTASASEKKQDGRALRDFVCGGLAGCSAAVLSQPFDVLRTRFAAQGEPKVYRSFADAAASMARSEGLRSFFKGLTPSLLLVFPQAGFQFTFFNVAQSALTSNYMPAVVRTDVYRVNALICGAFAGMSAKLIVYPIELLKRRLQVQGFEQARAAFGKLHRSRGLLHSALIITRNEGFAAFYKGLSPSLLTAACLIGFRFFFYDLFCVAVSRFKADSSRSGSRST